MILFWCWKMHLRTVKHILDSMLCLIILSWVLLFLIANNALFSSVTTKNILQFVSECVCPCDLYEFGLSNNVLVSLSYKYICQYLLAHIDFLEFRVAFMMSYYNWCPSHQVMSLVLCLEFIKSLNMELIFSPPSPSLFQGFLFYPSYLFGCIPMCFKWFLILQICFVWLYFSWMYYFLLSSYFSDYSGSLLGACSTPGHIHFAGYFPFLDLLEERKSLFPA